MYPELFRRIIFPALDRLNRTRIHEVLRLLAASESYSRERLHELQEEKLRRIVSAVRKDSSFYRRHWENAGEERRLPSLYPELDRLPIVTKEDLRSALAEFPLPPFRGRSLRVQTSGSTGVPMTFIRSAEQESWFWALRLRMWEWAGYRMGEPYLTLNLNARLAWKKKLQDLLFRCTYLTYNADTQNSQHIVDCLQSRRIAHINAFGSTLFVLAQYMREHGVTNPGVRVLTSTGDNLFGPQRQLIEEVFGVGVTDYYGAGGEGLHLASQCGERGRYHLHMESSVVEVMYDGRPARPGEVGTLVVTQLDNYAMPLVRYELGDLATLAEDRPCPCGRAHPAVIEAINGRACDLIYTPAGAVLLPQFFFIGAFKTLERVHRYQIVQDELERVTIKLVPEEGCDHRKCEESLRVAVDRLAQGSLGVDFEWVSEIPLADSGKPRPVISNLRRPPLTSPPASP